MKKLFFVLMACVLSLGLVGGAFAYFSDTETSTGNVFTAGTLDLKVDTDPTSGETWADSPLGNINTALDALVNNMKPGDSISGNFGIKNAGTINASKVDFMLTITSNLDNGQNDPELAAGDAADNVGELAANVDVVLNYNGSPVYNGTLAGLSAAGNQVVSTTLAAGATGSWSYTISIAAGVGNIIQSDSVTFDIVFSLDQ